MPLAKSTPPVEGDAQQEDNTANKKNNINKQPFCQSKTSMSKSEFLSTLYTPVLTRFLNELKRDAKIGETIRTKLGKNKIYRSTKVGRQLQDLALAHATKVGMVTMEKVIVLSNAALLANLGVPHHLLPNVAHLSPSSNTL